MKKAILIVLAIVIAWLFLGASFEAYDGGPNPLGFRIFLSLGGGALLILFIFLVQKINEKKEE